VWTRGKWEWVVIHWHKKSMSILLENAQILRGWKNYLEWVVIHRHRKSTFILLESTQILSCPKIRHLIWNSVRLRSLKILYWKNYLEWVVIHRHRKSTLILLENTQILSCPKIRHLIWNSVDFEVWKYYTTFWVHESIFRSLLKQYILIEKCLYISCFHTQYCLN
jgi:hypothetical protein